jgi:phosphoribosyl-ATP pyrophosphohydrolase/phosphoribosyl-AMP cyclohydrolase
MNEQNINWDKCGGMIPAIIQDARTAQVLMLGYMTPESLSQTQETGKVTFFSRSKQRLWTKGESSGNTLDFVSYAADCDGDALLIKALPAGPTCHTGNVSCFADDALPSLAFLSSLETLIQSRKATMPEGSYTAQLFSAGRPRMAQKVGEEAIEVALAAALNKNDDVANETADLIFHLLVLLTDCGVTLSQAIVKLSEREGTK